MAAQISHILAGEEALRRALGELSPPAIGYFNFGCQGPDIFYHNQRTKPSGLHYGSLAHRRRFGSLVSGAAAALSAEDRTHKSPAGAYILGLATHAAIDRATHPFIICFSGWADPAEPATQKLRGCHPFLERILDRELLERRLGIKPADYGLSARLGVDRGAIGADAALVGPWAAGLRAAFPRSTSSDPLLEKRIANALADARGFYAITDPALTASGLVAAERLARLDPQEGRYLVSLVYPELPLPGMDALNEEHASWPHPSGDGRSSRSSYLELIEEGIAEAAGSIRLVLEFWKGKQTAASLAAGLGEGGLALCDELGGTLAPRISKPLPLSEAMDAEYAARRAGARSL
jgi:hypothetical protein